MLEKVSPCHYRLSGQVSISESASVLKALFAMLTFPKGTLTGTAVLLDLNGIESADSVLLAVLLETARRVELAGGYLQVSGLPGSLQGLARVYGLEALVASYKVAA